MSVPGSTAVLLPGESSRLPGSWLTTASPSPTPTPASGKHVLRALALGEGVVVGGATRKKGEGKKDKLVMHTIITIIAPIGDVVKLFYNVNHT